MLDELLFWIFASILVPWIFKHTPKFCELLLRLAVYLLPSRLHKKRLNTWMGELDSRWQETSADSRILDLLLWTASIIFLQIPRQAIQRNRSEWRILSLFVELVFGIASGIFGTVYSIYKTFRYIQTNQLDLARIIVPMIWISSLIFLLIMFWKFINKFIGKKNKS